MEPQLGAMGLSEQRGDSYQGKVPGTRNVPKPTCAGAQEFSRESRAPAGRADGSFVPRILEVQPTNFTVEETEAQEMIQLQSQEKNPGLLICRLVNSSPKSIIPWGTQAGWCLHEVWVQKATAGLTLPALESSPSWPLYLVPGGEAAPALVPRDLGMGLPGHHTVQIQSLPFSHV